MEMEKVPSAASGDYCKGFPRRHARRSRREKVPVSHGIAGGSIASSALRATMYIAAFFKILLLEERACKVVVFVSFIASVMVELGSEDCLA